ncbi:MULTISPECIES: hypothetical protein [unclassified Streptomyces]|uniref:hypothetical protein n=1 Tax=unclassified Streptomyces TaxID=2593676 RepID=UPI0006FF502F|nr:MULTISPECIES: hypothetical protein [unclassified Streptomyces]KQX47951.1 hypothetical protein ASD33_19730 [Streptomyces sp. Root1304]KRA82342.1 hypothetical protein ASE09_14685 [Streptomyces sp. Root66D1]
MLAETICSAVSVAGLGVAAVMAYRKRFLSAARITAYALVPLGLVMTGAVDWIADTAFSPVAWAGFGVLGAAWLLFLSTRAVERRRGDRKETTGGAEPRAVAPGASAPSRAVAAKPPAGQSSGEDFSDIEAILKKHGI